MAERVLEAAGILKRFPGVLALDHVSLTLAAGEVHALAGENGAGKSTLIKVLAGFHRPDAGELRYLGRRVRFGGPRDARRAGIGTVHQDAGLVPQMSVARNLFLGREPRTRLGLIDTARMHARSTEILGRYGLDHDVRRPLGALGAGARRLVALARACSSGARVVLMDEPTSSLEPPEVAALFRIIADLRAEGRSVLYVSHRLDELYEVCDRITVLRDGQVVRTGPPEGLDRLTLVSLMLGRRPARPEPFRERPVAPAVPFPGPVPGDPPFLEATGLTRRNALTDVSIALRRGEVLGLGGLLGAGRTETAKAIAGALPLDSGQVVVAGAPLRRRSITGAVRAGVGLLPENRTAEGLVPTLSVRDNIALAALPRLSRYGVVSGARVDRVVDTFMRRLHIKATSPHQKVAELSGGNQQKVLLARWLAMHSKVLLLDQPTRGVDVGAKAEMLDLLDDLAVDGLAVLLISSDLEELVSGCDRVVVLREGAVVAELSGPQVTEDGIMSALAATG
ncbi:sugar ABC transporter ATP-binding protein [Actinomadura viridis]|uniref:Ribose transport system ATP-binding protein n=1 Tax=Actinomadura viridis TaxID=58110 RepID=A0A931DPJ5_9ACTN|nr:sugar ABC transporter ATP-binding protein [Actinomadura viridis]MBG6093457.1 ribose transport system ATP-binding protein [Actinomadura viridis]